MATPMKIVGTLYGLFRLLILIIIEMKLLSIRIPSIAQNSAIYIVFNVLQRAINFFLLPLYTIYLTPEDYGTINVLTSTAALLTFLLTFSVQSASSRFHYKYKRSDSIIKTIWGSNLIL